MLNVKPGRLSAFSKEDQESSLMRRDPDSEVKRLVVVLKFRPGRLPSFY